MNKVKITFNNDEEYEDFIESIDGLHPDIDPDDQREIQLYEEHINE